MNFQITGAALVRFVLFVIAAFIWGKSSSLRATNGSGKYLTIVGRVFLDWGIPIALVIAAIAATI